MSGDNSFPFPGADPFTAFWTEFTQKMMTAGMPTPPPNPSAEAMSKIRRFFFDSMAKHAEEFMRSEAFLKSMKQAMDNGLAWQQMMNQAMQKGLSGFQMPTRADADHLALLVRGMEDRVVSKIEELQGRIERLESGSSKSATKTTKAGRE